MVGKQNNEFVGIEEAARLTGYTVHTLRKYVQLRRVPFYQREKGSPLRFKRTELMAWAEPKRVDPAA